MQSGRVLPADAIDRSTGANPEEIAQGLQPFFADLRKSHPDVKVVLRGRQKDNAEAFASLPDDRDLVVFSDSQLCVNTINEWAPGWEKRGWKRKGGPIKNLDLVQQLYALALAKPRVELRWIRAHEGVRWNEYADALAALGA